MGWKITTYIFRGKGGCNNNLWDQLRITGRHENCLEHGQHAGGTIMEHLRNQIMAFNGKILRLPQ